MNKLDIVRSLDVETWGMLQMIAATIHEAHVYPGISSPAAAAAILLTSRDIGVPYSAGLSGIHLIQGKPSLSPALAWGIIRASGLLKAYRIEDHVDEKGVPSGCTVMLQRVGEAPYTLTVTVADARRAGLVKPGGGWEAWPGNMCRWRALGFVEDVVFPDLLFGIKRSDDLGAEIDQDGNVVGDGTIIDGEAVVR